MVVLVRRRLICKERLASIMNFLEEVEVPWIRKRHVKRKLFDLRCSAPYTIWDMGQTGQYIGKAESVCFRSLQKQICPRAILGKAAFVNEYSILKAVSQGTWARSQLHAEIAVIPLNKISWQQLGQKQKDCLLQFRACSSWGLDPSDIDLPERLAAAAAAASKFFKFQGATSVTSWIHLMGGHLAFHLGWPRRQWHVRDVKNLRDVGACKFGSGMLCLIPLELTRGCCCYSFSGFHDGGIWESLWNHAICTQMITSPNPRLCQVEIHDKKQIIDSLKRALQESQDLRKLHWITVMYYEFICLCSVILHCCTVYWTLYQSSRSMRRSPWKTWWALLGG